MASPAEPTVLRADRPEVIDEIFDGEAVLVHLGTGCYYALNAAATEVWTLARDGATPGALAAAVAGRGDGAAEATAALLAELREERLLVEAPAGSAAAAPAPALGTAAPWTDPPTVQRFADLQDLLLVDPIHDVTLGADGWPVAAGS